MEIFIQAKDYYSQLAQIYTVCDTQYAICQADKPHALTNVKFMLYSDIFIMFSFLDGFLPLSRSNFHNILQSGIPTDANRAISELFYHTDMRTTLRRVL